MISHTSIMYSVIQRVKRNSNDSANFSTYQKILEFLISHVERERS